MTQTGYRIVGVAQRAELDERWRITARMPAFDQAGWSAYFASGPEQYGRVFLLKAGTGPSVPTFPDDFMPRAGRPGGARQA